MNVESKHRHKFVVIAGTMRLHAFMIHCSLDMDIIVTRPRSFIVVALTVVAWNEHILG
jgi:hypothetical protein